MDITNITIRGLAVAVRAITRWDLPEICRMLRNFRSQTPIDLMNGLDDEQYISKIMNVILVGGGVALVAVPSDDSNQLCGMIAGIINQSVWDPKLLVLNEMVYWVEPEYRNTRMGYKLLKEYVQTADALVDAGRIKMYTMTKMVNSPDLKLDRFGFRKTEEVWVGGI